MDQCSVTTESKMYIHHIMTLYLLQVPSREKNQFPQTQNQCCSGWADKQPASPKAPFVLSKGAPSSTQTSRLPSVQQKKRICKRSEALLDSHKVELTWSIFLRGSASLCSIKRADVLSLLTLKHRTHPRYSKSIYTIFPSTCQHFCTSHQQLARTDIFPSIFYLYEINTFRHHVVYKPPIYQRRPNNHLPSRTCLLSTTITQQDYRLYTETMHQQRLSRKLTFPNIMPVARCLSRSQVLHGKEEPQLTFMDKDNSCLLEQQHNRKARNTCKGSHP